MHEEPPHFPVEGTAVQARLSLGRGQVYDNVAEEVFPLAWDLFHALVDGEGDDIGSTRYPPVMEIQHLHPPVVHKEDADLRSLEIELLEEPQGIPS